MSKLYVCDPEKNTECKKTECQVMCFLTTDARCADDKCIEIDGKIYRIVCPKIKSIAKDGETVIGGFYERRTE